MHRAGLALKDKSSIVLFPEGGIYTKNPPKMAPFKNGAFRLALDKQIPIIPITLSYNHLILPDDGKFLLRLRKAKMVLHEAIVPQQSDTEETLKQKCFHIIQNQLDEDNGNQELE